MKTMIDSKPEHQHEQGKLIQTKAAKYAVSSTYLKKFKSTSNKMMTNQNGLLSQGQSHGQLNPNGGQISFIN